MTGSLRETAAVSHLRTAWVPVTVGVLGGGILAAAMAASVGADLSGLTVFLFLLGVNGIAGAIIGAVSAGAMIAAAGLPSTLVRVAVGVVITAAIAGLGVAAVTGGRPREVWTAVAVGVLAPVAHGIAAERQRRRAETPAGTRAAGERPIVGGLLAIVVGCLMMPVLAPVAGPFTCSWLVGGEAGDGVWMCPDGKVLLGAALAATGAAAVGIFIGIGLAFACRGPRRRAAAYLVAATAALAGVTTWTVWMMPEHEYPSGDDFVWIPAMLPAVVLVAAAVLVVAVGAAGGRYGGAVAGGVVIALLLAACIVQPALAAACAPIAGFVIAAAFEVQSRVTATDAAVEPHGAQGRIAARIPG